MRDQLIVITDHAVAEAERRSAGHLACYAGCSVCCFGPFAITELDAQRLRAGVAGLPPHVAAAVRERARLASGHLGTDRALLKLAEEELAKRFLDLACPALDPESGRCLVYEHRPFACRTYGPPLLIDGEALPPCPLCFRGATLEQVEAARVTLETGTATAGLDTALQERTLIAWAIAGG